MTEQGCILAFDFGLVHIGVAVGQTITRTARGLTTLRAREGIPNWIEIRRLVQEYQPTMMVVGLPLNMDGSNSRMASAAERFAAKLAKHTGITTHMHDERLTSRAAREQLDQAKAMGRASTDHELAACLIAESWLTDVSA